MNRLLAILLLFAGLVLLLLGALLMLTGLFPYTKTPTGPCWPVMAVGLGMAVGGWPARRGPRL